MMQQAPPVSEQNILDFPVIRALDYAIRET